MGYTQKWGASRESSNDSIAAGKAWQKMKAGYLKKPGGEKEWNMEKNEFYYDTDRNKLRLIPTDDGEIQDESFKSKLKSWQKAPLEEVYNMTPNATEEESKAVRDKFDKTYMKGSSSPNKVHKPGHDEPRQEEYLRQQVENYPKPMPANAPDQFLQTAPKRLFQSYIEEGNKGWPTKEYLQGKYEDYMGYGSENPNAPGFGTAPSSLAPINREVDRESRKHRRYVRVDNRFLDKVEQGKKGTDMDIAKHEKRLKKIAKRKDINPMDAFHLYHGNRGARGYYDNK